MNPNNDNLNLWIDLAFLGAVTVPLFYKTIQSVRSAKKINHTLNSVKYPSSVIQPHELNINFYDSLKEGETQEQFEARMAANHEISIHIPMKGRLESDQVFESFSDPDTKVYF